MERKELERLATQLNARLMVAESALDAIFTVASNEPRLSAVVLSMFEINLAARQEVLAGSTNTALKQELRRAAQSLIAALTPATP